MPLVHLDVVDVHAARPLVDAEDRIAQVAEVADGDGKPRPVGARRAEQDRLLGSAAGAANASQLEDRQPGAAHVSGSSASAAIADAGGQRERAPELVRGGDGKGAWEIARQPATPTISDARRLRSISTDSTGETGGDPTGSSARDETEHDQHQRRAA